MIFKQKCFIKKHRPTIKGKMLLKSTAIWLTNYCIMSLTFGLLNQQHINTIYKILNKATKKEGKFICVLKPNHALTARTPESRMGSGKGNIKVHVLPIKENTILCGLNISPILISTIVRVLGSKLPLKLNYIKNILVYE